MPDGYHGPDKVAEPEPVVLTYMAVLEEVVGSVATFEAGGDATIKLDREHWVSLGRPGTIDVRVRDMAGL